MGVLTLDRDKWKQFKEANGFSKSSFFKKADVGPTIDKFQTAMKKFEASKSEKDLMDAFKKAEALKAAFAKFINLKEAKAEMTAGAKQRLEKWSGELDDYVIRLAKFVKAFPAILKANDKKQMDEQLDQFIL